MDRTPKYRRHPNGQAFVSHKSIATRSKRLYLGVWDSPASHRRYREFVAGLVEADRGAAAVVAGGTAAAAGQAWLEQHKHAGGEYNRTRVALEALEGSGVGGVACTAFGPAHLLAVRSHLAARYARSTANRHLARIRAVVRWGCLAGWFPADTWQRLAVVRGLRYGELGVRESPGVQPVAWSTVRPLLPHLPAVVAAMVRVQYWGGMRPGEVVAMRGCEIDQAGPVWLYRPARHKNTWRGQSLVKALPGSLQSVLEPYLRDRGGGLLFVPQGGRRRSFSVATYRHQVVAAQSSLGWSATWSPAQLRHGIATELAAASGVEAAQRWLGHANLQTTEIYAARQVRELVGIAAAVDRLAAGSQ